MSKVHKEDKKPGNINIKQLIDASTKNRLSVLSKTCKESKKKGESK